MRWGVRSRPARRRPAGAARGRSRTGAWSCCRAIPRCAPRSSASWTSRPRAPTGVTWPPTSLLSSARRSGQARRRRAASGAARVSRLGAHGRRRRPARAARPPAARAARPSARSPGSRCTGWRRGSSSAPTRRTRCPKLAAAVGGRRGRVGGPARRGDRHRRRGRPLRAALRRGAADAGAGGPPVARPPDARRRPAREPERQGHGAHRAGQGRGAGVRASRTPRHRLRDAPADGEAGRRAPARRHGVDGLARPDHRARDRAPERAGVPRRPVGGDRAAGLPARTPTSSSTSSWTASHQPFTIRLVKGAYWEHETVEARQNGWSAPGLRDQGRSPTARSSASRKRLIDARPHVNVAIASPQRALDRPRARATAPDRNLEFQVLRGLGDDLQVALTDMGLRVRTYCPVGDLVAGHELPRAPPAREHVQRLVPAQPLARRGPRRAARQAMTPVQQRAAPRAAPRARARPAHRRHATDAAAAVAGAGDHRRRAARRAHVHEHGPRHAGPRRRAGDGGDASRTSTRRSTPPRRPRPRGRTRARTPARRSCRRAAGELRSRRHLLAALAVRECGEAVARGRRRRVRGDRLPRVLRAAGDRARGQQRARAAPRRAQHAALRGPRRRGRRRPLELPASPSPRAWSPPASRPATASCSSPRSSRPRARSPSSRPSTRPACPRPR